MSQDHWAYEAITSCLQNQWMSEFPDGAFQPNKQIKRIELIMSLVKAFPNISHLVCGHIHRTISGNIQGKSFSIFKSTCHQMPMHQTSNKSSLSVAEPPAYGMLLINNTDIVAHSIDYELSDLKTLGSEATQN